MCSDDQLCLTILAEFSQFLEHFPKDVISVTVLLVEDSIKDNLFSIYVGPSSQSAIREMSYVNIIQQQMCNSANHGEETAGHLGSRNTSTCVY